MSEVESEADHVKADLREHSYRLLITRERLRRAREDATAAEHRLADAMRRVLDAGGIIAEELAAIDPLLDQLHELIPRQRDSDN